MRAQSYLTFLTASTVSASTDHFKVFHNTLDPAVFGTVGGADLVNATGAGYVGAVTICIRFQGGKCMKISLLHRSLGPRFNSIKYFFGPLLGPFFGPFFSPFFEIAYCNSGHSK